MRYVQKPRQIEAHVWNGYDGIFEVIEEWMAPQPVDRLADDVLAIHSMNHGTRTARIGDYVCRDLHDKAVFVMAPEGFKLLYEPVDEEEA